MKALTDTAPSDFIRLHRLNKAKTLLESGAANVSETAWQVGFNGSSYFQNCTRKNLAKRQAKPAND